MNRDGVSMCAKVTVICGVPACVGGGARRMQDEVMDEQIGSARQLESGFVGGLDDRLEQLPADDQPCCSWLRVLITFRPISNRRSRIGDDR